MGPTGKAEYETVGITDRQKVQLKELLAMLTLSISGLVEFLKKKGNGGMVKEIIIDQKPKHCEIKTKETDIPEDSEMEPDVIGMRIKLLYERQKKSKSEVK